MLAQGCEGDKVVFAGVLREGKALDLVSVFVIVGFFIVSVCMFLEDEIVKGWKDRSGKCEFHEKEGSGESKAMIFPPVEESRNSLMKKIYSA
jgi:hypothetical protein